MVSRTFSKITFIDIKTVENNSVSSRITTNHIS